MFEEMVARRWSEAFIGNPLALRTMSEIRRIVQLYAAEHGYDYAIIDTSPSLGPLNKIALTTVDAFLIPCGPDLFSLYGVRNIGNSLHRWTTELRTLYTLIPPGRRTHFPDHFVRFLGYTVYNAKLRTGATKWDMAIAHYDYARQIADMVKTHVPRELSEGISESDLADPIGMTSVMHTHNTFPTHAQKYNCPMWDLPTHEGVAEKDRATIQINRQRYSDTKAAYRKFAQAVVERVDSVMSQHGGL